MSDIESDSDSKMKKVNKKYEKLIIKVKKLYGNYAREENPGEFLSLIKPSGYHDWHIIYYVKPTIEDLLSLVNFKKEEISYEKYVKKYNIECKKIRRSNIYWSYLWDIKKYFKNEIKCLHGINLFINKKTMIISCKNCRLKFDLFEKNTYEETHEAILIYQGRSTKTKEQQRIIIEMIDEIIDDEITITEETTKMDEIIDERFIMGESFTHEIIDEITGEIIDEKSEESDKETLDGISEIKETNTDDLLAQMRNDDPVFEKLMIDANIIFFRKFSESLVNNIEPGSFNLIDIFQPINESNNLENINENILKWNNNFYIGRQICLKSIYHLGYYFDGLKTHFNNAELLKFLRKIGIKYEINYINKIIKVYNFAKKYPGILKSNWAFSTLEKEIKKIRIFFSKKLNEAFEEEKRLEALDQGAIKAEGDAELDQGDASLE